ncbi:MAG TPA: hypothetical protein VHJ38_15140 [Nitrososphaeraceae archaeon]|nr:hypothetical protein [Nitrososphaeraceae archaeon]
MNEYWSRSSSSSSSFSSSSSSTVSASLISYAVGRVVVVGDVEESSRTFVCRLAYESSVTLFCELFPLLVFFDDVGFECAPSFYEVFLFLVKFFFLDISCAHL